MALLDSSSRKIYSYYENLFTHQLLAYQAQRIALATLLLALFAQISFYLPWTPVPITGQTFAVALIAYGLKPKEAMQSLFMYLTLGFIGLPIFAGAKTTAIYSASSGYLIGMLFAVYLMSSLFRRINPNHFLKIYFVLLCGSITIFLFGLIGLSFFIRTQDLFKLGLYPFLLGDFIKSASACCLIYFLIRNNKLTREKCREKKI